MRIKLQAFYCVRFLKRYVFAERDISILLKTFLCGCCTTYLAIQTVYHRPWCCWSNSRLLAERNERGDGFCRVHSGPAPASHTGTLHAAGSEEPSRLDSCLQGLDHGRWSIPWLLSTQDHIRRGYRRETDPPRGDGPDSGPNPSTDIHSAISLLLVMFRPRSKNSSLNGGPQVTWQQPSWC